MNASGTPTDPLGKVAEELGKAQEHILKSREVLLGPLNTDIATTPHEIVYEEDRVKLKHYFPMAEARLKTPLLMVYALINRETMLDLQPGRSVVENVLKEGVDLYMIDWGYPTRKDRYQGIDDHVNGYLNNFVDFIRERHGLQKINLMGICMGGSFCIMYSALHPEKIKNLITTVTPSNFDHEDGLLNIWAKAIDPDLVVNAYGNMPGDLLNIGFLLVNPARLMIDKYVGYFENVHDKVFVENFVRMEKWIFDSPDVPGETYREFIQHCFRDNLLIQSKMELAGKRIDLKNITMPLLNIYGRFDNLVPPAACELLTSRVGSRDTEDLCLDTGHIGIYVSGKSQKELAPKIARWLLDRDGEDSGAATPSSPGGDETKPGEKPRRKPSSDRRKKK
ncbi:MAG TPA: class III poly(R)-hydroxyalkanoic acid synthase subunit PhaC [Syntrophobacteraceae bacterium]|nr:class III poly(R)-hydroxyalkanoic acid synthase subunit PhaC [Syntrophobacteraceae bacterium]